MTISEEGTVLEATQPESSHTQHAHITVHVAVVHASHAPAEMLAAFATLVDTFF